MKAEEGKEREARGLVGETNMIDLIMFGDGFGEIVGDGGGSEESENGVTRERSCCLGGKQCDSGWKQVSGGGGDCGENQRIRTRGRDEKIEEKKREEEEASVHGEWKANRV